jgi:hypothetical protein
MTVWSFLVTGLKILAVCLVFAVSFVTAGSLSGLNKIGQQMSASKTPQQAPVAQQAIVQPDVPTNQPRPQVPENFLGPFLVFSVCVGFVVSYLIIRSSWQGWPLVAAISVGIYGISTIATQIESVFFLSNKLPPGMIRAIFLQGAIATLLFAPLAALLLGKWRAPSQSAAPHLSSYAPVSFWAWRLALVVAAFVFFYMFFGYYVAWQNPAVRQYYGSPEYSSFYDALRANWIYHRWIYPLQVFRGLLYAVCLYPLMRMLRVARWEVSFIMALFLSVWTTALLLPNPVMPANVARTHLWETLFFNLVLGILAGSLLSTPPKQELSAVRGHNPAPAILR